VLSFGKDTTLTICLIYGVQSSHSPLLRLGGLAAESVSCPSLSQRDKNINGTRG
jgi:hypothetical protein